MIDAAPLRARARLNARIRRFFDGRGFIEVETPNLVEAPGTDVHLEPLRASTGFLHTSPEFAMKRLLVAGMERIYQLCKVYRGGEVTDLHHPEFTILEWYRARAGVSEIVDDVEALVSDVLPGVGDFERPTMQDVVEASCGFDILEALDFDALREACEPLGIGKRATRWDELFFELAIERIEPHLADLGAVFVTEWPAPLAILARKKPGDERVAERFELYVDGIELANGFQELTDPDEQRARFERDNAERRALGLPELPMPEEFLAALEDGLPRSAGVALGVDRLLMLQTSASAMGDVLPFRDE